MKLLTFASLVCAALADVQPASAQTAGEKNVSAVVIYLVDDWGSADTGLHDPAKYIQTPFIDSKLATGLVMTNAYVQPICSPTRSQLLSGRYQIHTGLQHGVIRPSQPNGLPLQFKTMMNYLHEADTAWENACFGKWHVGFYKEAYTPWQRGCDEYKGYLLGAEDYYEHTRSYDQFNGFDFRNGSEVFWAAKGTYSADILTEAAVRKIHSHAAQYGASKPLFLYLPLQNVHAPLQAPPGGLINRFKDIGNADRRTYAAMLLAADQAIANVSQALYDSGLATQGHTIELALQDNGGQIHAGGCNWPLRGNKGTLWQGGVRTRAVWFGTHPAVNSSRTYDGMWHVSDLLPTVVQGIAGVDVSGEGLDGVDQWQALAYGAAPPRSELLHNIDPLSNRAAITVGDMKLLVGNIGWNGWHVCPGFTPNPAPPTPGPEPGDSYVGLFNTTADPREMNDLSKSMPDMVDQLMKRLEFYNSSAVPCRYPDSDPASNPKKHGGAWGPWE